jgi:hypothetical protein
MLLQNKSEEKSVGRMRVKKEKVMDVSVCCGFKPDRGRWIFMGDKNPYGALPSEGK